MGKDFRGGKDDVIGGGRGAPRDRGGGRGGRMGGASKAFVVPHPKLAGVFVAKGQQEAFVTKNMVSRESVQNEKRISVEDKQTGEKVQYRVWNPFRSKIATSIIGDVNDIFIKPGAKVLFFGTASGTAISQSKCGFINEYHNQVMGLIGIGLIDISIVEAKSLRMTSSRITQRDNYKFLGLHQYLDCQLQQVFGEYYLQSLFVTSVLNFEIIDMQIKFAQSYNSPILYYKSSEQVKQQQFERIHFSPNLIGEFVQLISYREISGYKWVQSNVSQRFDTPYHEKWMLELCLPMFLILAILIPIYFFYGLYSNSNLLDDKKVRFQWGYLYNEYTKRAYFSEVIKILQKELMIIFLTYYDDNVIIKATIISLIIGVYLELSLKYQPYNLNNLNKLDFYSTNVCLASMALAIGVYVSEQSNSQEIQIPYAIVISILNFHITDTQISKILAEYLIEKTSNLDEKMDKLRNSIRNIFPFLQYIPSMRKNIS
ncbi:unnamed protein product [Paramecium pentaurelia]|uniref:Uncharacterized protein n=1 Tax=Paramecium pentaurelia TaxID=43138 RepID=A0A8S1T237_9CILI|nr:unnamed protein product [Paramecium pentaurelia]